MKRNEIDADQIHEIYEMADKSPQLQCRQISELLDACIALLPLQFSTQSSLTALLLSSHVHSPHSCASPLQLPLKLWPFHTTTSHATNSAFKEVGLNWEEHSHSQALSSKHH